MDLGIAVVAFLALVAALANTSIWVWMLPRIRRTWTVGDGLHHLRWTTALPTFAVSVLGYWVAIILIDRAFNLEVVPLMADRTFVDVVVIGLVAVTSVYYAWVFHTEDRRRSAGHAHTR